MKEAHQTAAYRVVESEAGRRFRFFCEASGAEVCVTASVPGENRGEALMRAWKAEGRSHFNQCHRCGRWVSDVMYNADTLECVDCSPWEEQPAFCPQCGMRVTDDAVFCRRCNARLRYGGSEEADGSPVKALC